MSNTHTESPDLRTLQESPDEASDSERAPAPCRMARWAAIDCSVSSSKPKRPKSSLPLSAAAGLAGHHATWPSASAGGVGCGLPSATATEAHRLAAQTAEGLRRGATDEPESAWKCHGTLPAKRRERCLRREALALPGQRCRSACQEVRAQLQHTVQRTSPPETSSLPRMSVTMTVCPEGRTTALGKA